MTRCGPHCPPASRRALRGPPRAPGQAQNCRLFALSPSPRPPRPPSAHLSGRPVPPDRRRTARVSGGGGLERGPGQFRPPGALPRLRGRGGGGSPGGGAGARGAAPPPAPAAVVSRRKRHVPKGAGAADGAEARGGKLGISLRLLRNAEFAWRSSQGLDHVRSVIPYHAAQRVPNAAGGSGKAFGARQE